MTDTTTTTGAPAPRPAKPLARAEAWVRHLLLKVGFGFAAFVLGSLVSGVLSHRLNERLSESENGVFAIVVGSAVYRLWVIAVLPLTVHLILRFFPLSPVSTAVVGALTGELFQLGITGASIGFDGIVDRPGLLVLHAVTMAAGIALSIWAGKRGRAWADERQRAAELEAAAKKKQYEEFVNASNAIAERNEQRQKEQLAAAPALVEAAPPAAPADVAPPSPPPTDPPKT